MKEVKERLEKMSDDDLRCLLRAINFTLSGDTIGEDDAFQFMAEIEAAAIRISKVRRIV